MTTKPMTVPEFASILRAAGLDLDAAGHPMRAARLLGVHPPAVYAVKNHGRIASSLANAARTLAAAIADGSYTPPTTTTGVIALELPTHNVADFDPEAAMTDEQVVARTNKCFAMMRRFVEFAIASRPGFHAVLITGPGGIGKTYPVERMLEEAYEADCTRTIRKVTGAMSAVGLFEALWDTRRKGDILLIDDADGGLANQDFLNVLKAATDTKGRRVVSWVKQNSKLAEAGVEQEFEYAGSVIIISNANLKAQAEKNNSRAEHVDAVLSRAMHIDLAVNSARALGLRVKHMIEVEDMFAQDFAAADMADLYDTAKFEIGAFVMEQRDAFRSLTLREATKLARMWMANEGDPMWKEMALVSLGAF